MFFRTPDDLTNLDIAGGQCYNQSVPQNLTFGYQGLPLGIGDEAPVNGSGSGDKNAAAGLREFAMGWAFITVFSVLFWVTL